MPATEALLAQMEADNRSFAQRIRVLQATFDERAKAHDRWFAQRHVEVAAMSGVCGALRGEPINPAEGA